MAEKEVRNTEGKHAKTLFSILKILKTETDINHPLTQKQILDRLRNDADDPVEVDRRAVKRSITALQELGLPVCAKDETVRITPNKKTGELNKDTIYSGYYYENDFDDSELRLLIDSLLFSKYIPSKQCRNLIGKIEKLGNNYFQSKVKHVSRMPETIMKNGELTVSIETIDEAISKNRKVSFNYNEYQTDKKLHPKLDEDGKPKVYTVSPYQMAAANSRYYLICSSEGKSGAGNYRLDKISGIRILDEKRKPEREVKEFEHGLNLPKHMAEHIYMFSGESAAVTFRMKKNIIGDVIDWFGNDVNFSDETGDEVTARVMVNLRAMRRWALQYALYVRVIYPQSLAEDIKKDIAEAMQNYGG